MQSLPTITPATVDVIEALMADLDARWGLEITKVTGRAPGTVYLILDRLERSGWVVSTWEPDSARKGPRRRLYRLTGDALPAAHRVVAQHAIARQPIGQSFDDVHHRRPVRGPGQARGAGRAYDRAYYPPGIARQAVASVASGDRTERLRSLDVPTLVIHGADDLMCDISGGRATAAAIPGAELVVFDGMGHNLPRALWPEITSLIMGLVERAEAAPLGT